MQALVKVEGDSVVMTDTQIIARVLGMKHAYVMDVVYKFLADYPDLGSDKPTLKNSAFDPIIRLEERNYRGKDFTAAVMNQHCFSLLFMRFETPTARQMQLQFVRAFYEMEDRLKKFESNQGDPAFLHARQQGKIARREETDIIKEFVEYAKVQGSTHAEYYYKHLTNATYKALELLIYNRPPLRDTLNCYQLAELLLAERLVQTKLKEYMELGRNYKDIYATVADDLLAYGRVLHISAPSKQIKSSAPKTFVPVEF